MTVSMSFSYPKYISHKFAQNFCGQMDFSSQKVANLVKRLSMHGLDNPSMDIKETGMLCKFQSNIFR